MYTMVLYYEKSLIQHTSIGPSYMYFVYVTYYVIQSHYQEDYTNLGSILNFQNVFAIMFNGCTGIMG